MCRYGFGRAGCVAIGFVLAENPSMAYEDAVLHVTTRRPVLPHSGLRDALYRIYPRPWGPRTDARSSTTVYSEDIVPEPEVMEEPPAPEPETVEVQQEVQQVPEEKKSEAEAEAVATQQSKEVVQQHGRWI